MLVNILLIIIVITITCISPTFNFKKVIGIFYTTSAAPILVNVAVKNVIGIFLSIVILVFKYIYRS